MANMIPSHSPLKHDASFRWRPGRIWLPATSFSSYVGAAGATAGAHTGAPVFQEISTFGVVGLLMDTAADEALTFNILPYDIDLAKRIYARVHWTSGSADVADTVTWKVWYKPLIFNTTLLTAIGDTGGTALDKVVAAQDVPIASAYAWCVTEEGYLDAGKLPETTGALSLGVELDAFDAGLTEDKFLLGLELRYTPKRLWGPDGMPYEAKAPTHIAGKTYSS